MRHLLISYAVLTCFAVGTAGAADVPGQYPVKLPGGKQMLRGVVDGLQVDFTYYPGQNWPSFMWSAWGDGLAVGGKYYSAIGDHRMHAFLYEYDSQTNELRMILDVQEFLRRSGGVPEGQYTPGKIHSRIDPGSDGWLYFSTHRGGSDYTGEPKYRFRGDWILRHQPDNGKTETVAHAPVGKECIPVGALDPQRMMFYGGTQEYERGGLKNIFFAFDVAKRKVVYREEGTGPQRCMMLSSSTGRVYYHKQDGLPLRCFDPSTGKVRELRQSIGLRAATRETADGYIYTVGAKPSWGLESWPDRGPHIWQFNVKTEEMRKIGWAPVGEQTYIAGLDLDPTETYIYYIPGAHGGAAREGTPVVQFNVKTRQKKIICHMSPGSQKRFGYTPDGAYGYAISPAGDKLYVTWNGSRSGEVGSKNWDACALTVIHMPERLR